MNTEDELMEAELVEFARALDIDTKKPEKKYVFLQNFYANKYDFVIFILHYTLQRLCTVHYMIYWVFWQLMGYYSFLLFTDNQNLGHWLCGFPLISNCGAILEGSDQRTAYISSAAQSICPCPQKAKIKVDVSV